MNATLLWQIREGRGVWTLLPKPAHFVPLELPKKPPPEPRPEFIGPKLPRKRKPRKRRLTPKGPKVPKIVELLRDDAGAVLLEAALVIPILVMLSLGGAQWGMIGLSQAKLTATVNATAMDWAAGDVTDEEIGDEIARRVHAGMQWIPEAVVDTAGTIRTAETVLVVANIPGATAGLLGIVPSPATLTASALVPAVPPVPEEPEELP